MMSQRESKDKERKKKDPPVGDSITLPYKTRADLACESRPSATGKVGSASMCMPVVAKSKSRSKYVSVVANHSSNQSQRRTKVLQELILKQIQIVIAVTMRKSNPHPR